MPPSVGKKAPLPLKLVPDASLPPEKDRLPKRLGLELLGKQNEGHWSQQNQEKKRCARKENTNLGDSGLFVGHHGQRRP